ncbi:hypothetical protein EON81_27925, partial [bacterium]
MSPKVLALYKTTRIVLLAFVFTAAFKGEWSLAIYGLLLRTLLWWVALPHRRLKTGSTFGETWKMKMREERREIEISRIALSLAGLPLWANLMPRLILMGPPTWLLHDPVANVLLRRGKKAGPRLIELARSPEADVRAAAARALLELRPLGFEAAIGSLGDDPSDAVRAAVAVPGEPQVGSTSDPILRLLQRDQGDPVPEDLVQALRRTFAGMTPSEKEDVLKRLGECQGEPAIEWLLELGAQDDESGILARKAILKVDDARATELLVDYAERRPDSLFGLVQLQKRADPRVEMLLLHRLDSKRRTTQLMAMSLLGRIPTETARAALRD